MAATVFDDDENDSGRVSDGDGAICASAAGRSSLPCSWVIIDGRSGLLSFSWFSFFGESRRGAGGATTLSPPCAILTLGARHTHRGFIWAGLILDRAGVPFCPTNGE